MQYYRLVRLKKGHMHHLRSLEAPLFLHKFIQKTRSANTIVKGATTMRVGNVFYCFTTLGE